MTEAQRRQAVIDEALRWLGAKEADGSFLPILDAYNSICPLPRGYRMRDTDPWCAAFVSAVGALAGQGDAVLPECGCDAMIEKYRARGRFFPDASCGAQPGDLVFYNWDGDRSCDHVGLIAERKAGTLRVVEGNLNDAVAWRTIPEDWRCIQGFALPDYAGEGEALPEEQPDGGSGGAATAATARVPILARGDRGLSVRMMQTLLIARGFGCGPDGADGDFGGNTEAAVRSFQKAAGLEADGVCGPRSFEKLLGVTL